ncbi:hypothetical protein BJ165DRAFT_1399850 [Panaeolus papilionaceus]|nr:hypothetical protein BJ165DRAFT_1399850 [Panaeolus papilionaceus]
MISKAKRTSISGLLLPPADSLDTRPLYDIAVYADFMWPYCVITSVFKGSNADGDYVGGFIMSTGGGTSSLAKPSYGYVPISQRNHRATYATKKRLLFSVKNPAPEPTSTVTPEGHKYMDDIALSLLLLEKKRLVFSSYP